MSNKFVTFSAIFVGTIVFWGLAFLGFEIWVNLQNEMGENVIFMDDALEEGDKESSDFLENVHAFGPLRIGGEAPNGFGQIAPFEGRKIPKSNFYVYVHRRGLPLCEYDGCSIAEGIVIECMGGWFSGDGHTEISDLVGLDSAEVAQGRESIVVVADENSEIIGIYPNHTEGDILPILSQFPEYYETLSRCSAKVL